MVSRCPLHGQRGGSIPSGNIVSVQHNFLVEVEHQNRKSESLGANPGYPIIKIKG
jgi:hypothetical protein